MFNKEKRYVTGGIDERVPLELQCLMWASIEARIFFADEKIDYLQVFTFKKIDDEILIKHNIFTNTNGIATLSLSRK